MKKTKKINYTKKNKYKRKRNYNQLIVESPLTNNDVYISKKILKKGNEELQIINNTNINFINSNQNLDIFIFHKQDKLYYKINDFIIKLSIKEINSNIENIKKTIFYI